MIEYLFSHQEGLDLFALLPKRLKRINGVPVDEWLKAHEHEERTCHVIMTAKPFSQTQELRAKSCSSCGYIFESEAHRRMPPYYGEMGAIRATTLPNYCQCCGAKVER